MAYSCIVCGMYDIIRDQNFDFSKYLLALRDDQTKDVRITFNYCFKAHFMGLKYSKTLYNLFSTLRNQKNESLVREFKHIFEIYSEKIKDLILKRLKFAK